MELVAKDKGLPFHLDQKSKRFCHRKHDGNTKMCETNYEAAI